jgi:hypothetical protein
MEIFTEWHISVHMLEPLVLKFFGPQLFTPWIFVGRQHKCWLTNPNIELNILRIFNGMLPKFSKRLHF